MAGVILFNLLEQTNNLVLVFTQSEVWISYVVLYTIHNHGHKLAHVCMPSSFESHLTWNFYDGLAQHHTLLSAGGLVEVDTIGSLTGLL